MQRNEGDPDPLHRYASEQLRSGGSCPLCAGLSDQRHRHVPHPPCAGASDQLCSAESRPLCAGLTEQLHRHVPHPLCPGVSDPLHTSACVVCMHQHMYRTHPAELKDLYLAESDCLGHLASRDKSSYEAPHTAP
jgi:hypothetical protein